MIKNSANDDQGESTPVLEKSVADISRVDTEKILEQLRKNEKQNYEILKSVKFIKHYFAWQSLMSVIKYSLLAAIIVLGVISWRSIVDYTSKSFNGYLKNQTSSGINSSLTNLLFK
ncbi:MAG TPA: hypothetical protein VFD16_02200 [Candidatus Saccharimonadales bacterium]|nr:hypothetical protein [Candidatus Saccharimonadales bacterium]